MVVSGLTFISIKVVNSSQRVKSLLSDTISDYSTDGEDEQNPSEGRSDVASEPFKDARHSEEQGEYREN